MTDSALLDSDPLLDSDNLLDSDKLLDSEPLEFENSTPTGKNLQRVPLTELLPEQINCLDPFR